MTIACERGLDVEYLVPQSDGPYVFTKHPGDFLPMRIPVSLETPDCGLGTGGSFSEWEGKTSRIDRTNPKDLIGDTKPQLHLVPSPALVSLAKVMELGAKKYGAYNWRQNKVRATVYISAAMRHITSALDGEEVDPESGQSHYAHAAACMAILLDARATGNLIDDRPTPGCTARLIKELTVKKPICKPDTKP
jgi:hypothetical protein